MRVEYMSVSTTHTNAKAMHTRIPTICTGSILRNQARAWFKNLYLYWQGIALNLAWDISLIGFVVAMNNQPANF